MYKNEGESSSTGFSHILVRISRILYSFNGIGDWSPGKVLSLRRDNQVTFRKCLTLIQVFVLNFSKKKAAL